MKRIFFISIQLLAIAFSCRTFGQVGGNLHAGPKLIVGRKVVDFDSKYLSDVPEAMRFQLLLKTRMQIAAAKKQGITRIGNVDLNQLQGQLDQVKFKMINNDAEAVGVGEFIGRRGAVYFVENKTVFVNKKTIDNGSSRAASLMPHEIVSALGVDDRNSAFTILLSDPETNRDLIDQVSKPGSDFPKRLRSTPTKEMHIENGEQSGGVTVVGGGGDEILHEVKRTIINHRWLYRKLLKEIIFKEPKYIEGAIKAAGFDFLKYFNDENVLAQYDHYLLMAPMEAANPEDLPTLEPIKDLSALYKVMWVSRVDDVGNQREVFFPGPYMRISRDHWNYPVEDLTLEMSRHFFGMTVYIALFPEWLKDVYLVELQKASHNK